MTAVGRGHILRAVRQSTNNNNNTNTNIKNNHNLLNAPFI